MVLTSRRPRTVLGRLVGRAGPVGRRGLPPPGWLPLGLAGPAVPGRLPGHGCSGGSSPAADPLVAAGHAGPSPRPVAERTPADHHSGRMVAAGGDRGSLLLQWGEPVLAAPAGGVGGVDRRSPPVPALAAIWTRRSRNFPVGMPADQPPEAPAAPAARGPAAIVLASLLAGISEVQVLDHDRPAAELPGEPGQGADGGAEPPVALRRRAARPGRPGSSRAARPGSRPG